MAKSSSPSGSSINVGLLFLRVVAGGTLLLKHGLEKPANFLRMAAHFPNPLHIGSVPSFAFALISDFICSMLILVGFGTRWASLIAFFNIFVAWAFVHHFAFFGKDPGSAHGEVMVLYLAAMLTLLIAGPGAASIDQILSRKP